MPYATVIAILAVPFLFAIAVGGVLLKRACARPQRLPEEFALAAAWVFAVGSLVWLAAFLSGSTLLGFDAPWTWITAAHFAFAGFGALTVTALCCRVVSNRRALTVLRLLLVAHPIAYLVTAAGILGFRYCNEAGAASYELIFVTQWAAVVLGRPARIARGPWLLLVLALAVPLATMGPTDSRHVADGLLPRYRECRGARRTRARRLRLGSAAVSLPHPHPAPAGATHLTLHAAHACNSSAFISRRPRRRQRPWPCAGPRQALAP